MPPRPSKVPPRAKSTRPPEPPELAAAARLLGSGSYDAAEQILREILERDPKDAIAWFFLGEALTQRGEKAQATVAFTAAARHAHAGTPGVDAETLSSAARRRARG
jgi:Flp pilus assembly protein TadD